jgi:hypothetical protein
MAFKHSRSLPFGQKHFGNRHFATTGLPNNYAIGVLGKHSSSKMPVCYMVFDQKSLSVYVKIPSFTPV